MKVQFPFRRHYARRCHYCSHARLRPTRGHKDWTGRGAAARSRHLGSWFFSERGVNRSGTVLGWHGGIRLIALAFAMMVIVAFMIVIPAQVFFSKHLSPPP